MKVRLESIRPENRSSGVMRRSIALSLCLSYFAGAPVLRAGGESGSAAPSATAPAIVTNRVTEAELTMLALTAEAVARLDIQTDVAKESAIGRSRFFGGEVITPPGRTIQLAAPFAGTITAVAGTPPPAPGSTLKSGDPIVALQPVVMGEREVLTPSERIALAKAEADFGAAQALAEGDVSSARVQLEASRIRLDRAKRLRQENATSIKLLDEAVAEYAMSEAQLTAAVAKASAWKEAAVGMKPSGDLSVNLVAPFDGVLADLNVAPGEIIGANTPVARLIAMDPLWVRVPVYVGEPEKLLKAQSARIGTLDRRLTPDTITVERVAAAPTADPLAGSVDLFFRLPNGDGRFRPQQRVGVWIPDGDERRGLVIPWASVVYDVHGGAWVYEQIGPGRFVRRRVEVMAVEGDRALTSRGLKPGMSLVTTGTAELFGVEFGAGK